MIVYTYYNGEAQVPEVDPSTELRAEIGTCVFVECATTSGAAHRTFATFRVLGISVVRSPYLW